MKDKEVVLGQLVQVNFKKPVDGSSWGYGVVVSIFDGLYLVKRSDGGLTMVQNADGVLMTAVDGQNNILPLYLDGKPYKVKRNLLGKYKFPKH